MLFISVFLAVLALVTPYSGDIDHVNEYVDEVLSDHLPGLVEKANLDTTEMPDFYFNVQGPLVKAEVLDGTNYAGPIITKPNLKRPRVTLKSYIAIFICFSTKATHLEIISDLTTEAFLAYLRRFIARRFKTSVIWSDNATNFKGARNTFLMIGTKFSSPTQFSEEEDIEWNFTPPASPHFGGLWEANIKSTKRILLRVAKSAIMTFEKLITLITQIEAVLNFRPLSPLSPDPNDFNPLTVGHFLTGNTISSFPELYTASDSLSYHSRWKFIQSLRNKFWNHWSTEYLSHLQTRAKWSVQNPNLRENQLVLLRDPTPSPWTGLWDVFFKCSLVVIVL
ncbi:integrase catalytic domain-containing protein [Trichonephila inaurata madagascariensis]|uniref:Integrase catalytic domain-containing protein n=1 Tax=Trichonephila inaurata madagascariensis TaxID=2747483 RepID=A0A8X6Y509_9ARAC|nr:integrase catalytic domain-containing protein [Trichonephila inaurata madagascariensis]